MTPRLPELLTRYYAAANAHDADATVALFAEDAVVKDEQTEHRGREAIRAWIAETTRKYGPIAVEPTDVAEGGRTTVVTSVVSGNFKGSPATLRYTFIADPQKIGRLEIA
jgi:ketosteroid isomerase-like protein